MSPEAVIIQTVLEIARDIAPLVTVVVLPLILLAVLEGNRK